MHNFVVAGDLPGVAPGQELAVIDIASAQWRFGRLGTLDRVDVKLMPGTALADAKAQLSSILAANTQLSDAESESQRGDALSRAYRVNLDMLALVALLTGGFLVYSAQSLAVTRRLRQFALLRTLGLQERALAGLLLGEGAALGRGTGQSGINRIEMGRLRSPDSSGAEPEISEPVNAPYEDAAADHISDGDGQQIPGERGQSDWGDDRVVTLLEQRLAGARHRDRRRHSQRASRRETTDISGEARLPAFCGPQERFPL